MEDSHVESSEVKDARVRHAKAAAAAHEALLDAIHAAFGDSPPHGRLCVHWDGFGDHGCVDAVDWGFPDPAEEADAESLTCIIDEKAERPPSSVTEAAMNFVHRLIDFDRWLRDMEVGAGGDIAFILDCVSGRVSVSARRWVVKLRALDPRAERSWFLPVKKLEGEGFEEPRLGLDSGGAQAIARLEHGVSKSLRAAIGGRWAHRRWDRLAWDGLGVTYVFGRMGDKLFIHSLHFHPPAVGIRGRGPALEDLVMDVIDEWGIDRVCTDPAARSGDDRPRSENSFATIGVRLPINAKARSAAVTITRDIKKVVYQLEQFYTRDPLPSSSYYRPRVASAPAGPGL